MEPAGGVNVRERYCEQKAPQQDFRPPCAAPPGARRARADHVVAVIDGLQQREKMGLRPRLLRGGHEHQGQPRILEPGRERTREVGPGERHDALLDRPPGFGQGVDKGCDD
jgi:hypothetical protein